MCITLTLSLTGTLLTVLVQPSTGDILSFVVRDQWRAKPPKAIEVMRNPVPFVIIHHSYIPAACYNLTDCIGAMQLMQRMHQIDNGWNDIGYHFAVGSDGRVYEGRGWHSVGAHAPSYNNRSIGICLIGDWMRMVPPKRQLDAAQRLILFGIQNGHISPSYILHGHRQVRNGTECPGDALLAAISTWNHFVSEAVEKFYPKLN